jgi:hypothetical protein
MNLGEFNANEQEPMRTFEALPIGKYLAIISASEERQVKTNPDATYLALEFQVIDGQYKGRKLFVNLNLNNPNPEAVRIARAELGAICKAVGVLTPRDSSQLHDLPLALDVRMQKRKDTGEIQNKIVAYLPKAEIHRMTTSSAATAPATAGAGAAADPGKAPWARS